MRQLLYNWDRIKKQFQFVINGFKDAMVKIVDKGRKIKSFIVINLNPIFKNNSFFS